MISDNLVTSVIHRMYDLMLVLVAYTLRTKIEYDVNDPKYPAFLLHFYQDIIVFHLFRVILHY